MLLIQEWGLSSDIFNMVKWDQTFRKCLIGGAGALIIVTGK